MSIESSIVSYNNKLTSKVSLEDYFKRKKAIKALVFNDLIIKSISFHLTQSQLKMTTKYNNRKSRANQEETKTSNNDRITQPVIEEDVSLFEIPLPRNQRKVQTHAVK